MRSSHSVAWLVSFVAALWVQGCATTDTYSAKPITTMVVDAETGEPLEGVNVVARWSLEERRTGTPAGDLDLMETVTDKDGKFHFPSWKGKAPPVRRESWTDKVFVEYETRLSSGSPEIVLFKSGYRPSTQGNDVYDSPTLRDQYHTWERHSDWDGKVIQLQKFKGNLETYAVLVDGTTTSLGSGIACPWKKFPRYVAALIKEKERLNSLRVRNYLPSLQTMERYFTNEGCGSAREFFKDYLK